MKTVKYFCLVFQEMYQSFGQEKSFMPIASIRIVLHLYTYIPLVQDNFNFFPSVQAKNVSIFHHNLSPGKFCLMQTCQKNFDAFQSKIKIFFSSFFCLE